MKKILFGAGAYGLAALNFLGEENVAYFADNNKTGTFAGKRIININELKDIHKDFDIIISTSKPYRAQIRAQLLGKDIPSLPHTFELSTTDYKSDWHYEYQFTEAFIKALGRAKIIVDAGAEYGYYTDLAIRFAGLNDCIIYSFEPDPIKYDFISKRFSNNDKVNPINLAVSNKSGTVKMYSVSDISENNKVTNSYTFDENMSLKPLKDKIAQPNYRKVFISADTISLDEYLYPNNTPDIVKMDIEGAEIFALQGMENIIRKKQTVFFIEIHEPYIQSMCPDGMTYINHIFNSHNYIFYRCYPNNTLFDGQESCIRIVSKIEGGQYMIKQPERQ